MLRHATPRILTTAVRAQRTTPDCRDVVCNVVASSEANGTVQLQLTAHPEEFCFQKNASYVVYLDSDPALLPRAVGICDLGTSGNGVKVNVPFTSAHPFSLTMERCFIERTDVEACRAPMSKLVV